MALRSHRARANGFVRSALALARDVLAVVAGRSPLLLAAFIGLACAACSSDSSSTTSDAGAPSGDGGPGADIVAVPNVGMIAGSKTTTMRSFKGIPYAVPPVGPLRWKAPERAAPLTGVLDATKFGSGCVQDSSPFGMGSTDEDCLFLNVYAPTGSGPYPVMFWIHGGAFLSGESNEYDATELVAQGVVVVTINYRLGMLGFLADSTIDNGAGTASTNFGLLDQQLALAVGCQGQHRELQRRQDERHDLRRVGGRIQRPLAARDAERARPVPEGDRRERRVRQHAPAEPRHGRHAGPDV